MYYGSNPGCKIVAWQSKRAYLVFGLCQNLLTEHNEDKSLVNGDIIWKVLFRYSNLVIYLFP